MTDHHRSEPRSVNPVDALAHSLSRTTLPRSSFKVHKSLLKFAIPLSQFSDLPINKDKSVHVAIMIINHANQILIFGSRGLYPTGPVTIGGDKTLLEGVSRVVYQTTGRRSSTIKHHLGTFQYPFISSPVPEPAPRPETETTCDSPSTAPSLGKDSIVYVFLGTVGDEIVPSREGAKDKWKWCSKADIDGMDLSASQRKRLTTALKLMEDSRRTEVRIPPTRLIIPTFEVVKSLKAYLLPMEVFRSLPPLRGKQLIASVAVIHPTQRKILVVQRSTTDSWANHWEFPGGSVESTDLTILHTAVREVREETGLEIDRFRGVVGTFELMKKGSEVGSASASASASARGYVFLVKLAPCCSTPGHKLGNERRGEGEAESEADADGRGHEITVMLNPKEHQAYKWVGSRAEIEELEVPPNIRDIMGHVLDALNDATKEV